MKKVYLYDECSYCGQKFEVEVETDDKEKLKEIIYELEEKKR